jgi:hypothetical protein
VVRRDDLARMMLVEAADRVRHLTGRPLTHPPQRSTHRFYGGRRFIPWIRGG